MGKVELFNEILKLIELKHEGEYWDYKEKWQDNMDDLIKDIICFSNSAHYKDCYIIYGVTNLGEIAGVKEPRRKLAEINDAFEKINFATEEIPIIDLKSFVYCDKELDILVIKNTNKVPIFLKTNYGKMKAGCIYTRNGDKNTPDGGNALVSQIEMLWKKRLGLTKSKLEFIKEHLLKKEEWMQSSDEAIYKYFDYNIYLPEYTIEEIEEGDKFIKSWFSYTECNSNENRNIVQIKYNNTVLYGCGIITLDGGRYTTTYPDECLEGRMLDKIGYEICFNYYIKGTLKYYLHIYYLNKLSYCYESSYRDFIENILIFDNNEEFDDFKLLIKNNIDDIKGKMQNIEKVYHLEIDKEEHIEYVENCIKCSKVLQDELKIFRENRMHY